MATKISGKPKAATTDRKTKDIQGEYSIHNDESSGQEWILDAYSALEPRSYLEEFTSQNVRPDGRPFSASRPVTVLPSIFTRNSYGSAMVTLGGGVGSSSNSGTHSCCTRVIAACTLLVGHPSPSTPNEGDVDVTLTASPLTGPRFDTMGRESGNITSGNYGMGNDGTQQQQPQQLPGNLSNIISRTHNNTSTNDNTTPSPTDIKEIESWIRRTLRSSRFVNPTELGIETGVSAWRIRVSVHVLNHEGNVWDAALLCVCAALSDLRLPMVEIDRGVVRIVKNESSGDGAQQQPQKNGGNKKKAQRRKGRSLTLGPLPVPLTIAILPNDENLAKNKNILLVDPTHLEEDVAAGNTVTAVCNANEEIVEFQKKGSGSRLSVEQVAAVACMGFGRAKELEMLVLGR
mmetsp:Transcript_30835/g.56475  ORF Transcript_30835/g.56475 Transcript_30835/m.56475 type:complete len:403 (+) Transcript_30835:111-1319(+)|eukprot:CAMPEP_0201613838 /NCGR_PEP_ID=MMETSP0492-20130828/27131_1 /ASSEMBLY_ACC=CAM_ASM_000837 /TAXON_ID=420259 /ORGANISM="Thalassiosira gravida, Strain GMp14c1" /LENGTH=402 /DNA_ID=CAMNT_0048080883 /DNA_START=117 /DNA_END=1325 /DNA_ORIENTATION=-